MQHLHTDQGREIESKILQTMCKMLGVNKTCTASYHPQSDGWEERCNRALKDMLAKLIISSHNDCDVWIRHVLFAYRTAVNSSTGVTSLPRVLWKGSRNTRGLISYRIYRV